MTITELFAGIPVRDFAAAQSWYESLLGAPPSFFPTDLEAVWDLGEHRWLYIEQRPGRAGHSMITFLVDDLDARMVEIAGRGLEPVEEEDYGNGVRKMIFHDPDGNEIGFGNVPA